MRSLRGAALALVLASLPATLHAQDGWWDWSLRQLSVGVDLRVSPAHRHVPDVVWSPGPQYDRPGRSARVRGPAFCRSGAGHPVFGRRWCREKGFPLGGHRGLLLRWERRYWHDVLPLPRRRPFPGVLGRGELIDVLGPALYGRLDRQRVHLRGRHPLSGRWVRPHGSSLVLQIRSGPVAVAELTDLGADGWIDIVLVAGS